MDSFKGMIFDLDGTLLDSLGLWEEIDAAFLQRRGIAVPPDYSWQMTRLSYAEGALYTIRRFGLPETPEALIAEWDAMSLEAYRDRVPLKPGAYDFLFAQRQKGVQMGVATALSPACCEPVLRRNGVYDLFDAFAFVQETEKGKGFPDVYLLAARRLGLLPRECLVFEDIGLGIRGAKAGGFFTCGVADPSARQEWEQMRREADFFIESFADLLE